MIRVGRDRRAGNAYGPVSGPYEREEKWTIENKWRVRDRIYDEGVPLGRTRSRFQSTEIFHRAL